MTTRCRHMRLVDDATRIWVVVRALPAHGQSNVDTGAVCGGGNGQKESPCGNRGISKKITNEENTMNKNTQNVKWYPRLFTGDMVRALLDGSKTATRWPLRKQPVGDLSRRAGQWVWEDVAGNVFRSPVCPGDVIWARETWVELLAVSPGTDEPVPIGPGEQLIEPPTSYIDRKGNKRWNYDGTVIAYRANSDVEFCDGDGFSGDMADKDDMPRWRPNIHMPRRYARIFLRVTNIRLVRVQDISEAEAQAEGFEPSCRQIVKFGRGMSVIPAKDKFAVFWDSLYAARGLGWGANPWVWAADFQLISKDEVEA